MNSKLKSALLVILLLIPTYLAIFTYVRALRHPVELRSVTKLSVTDPAGQEHLYDKTKAAEKEEIRALIAINDGANEVSAVPDAVQQTTPFVAVYTCYNKTNTYTYYVGADPSNAYMTDTAGKAYKLSAEDAAAFTDLSFAACLYEGSKAPTLTVGSEAVTPHEYDWRYKRFSGTYTTVARETTDTVLSYRINAKLAMDFDVAPDLFTVRITDGDTEIFNDTYENIVNLQIDESRELLFHVEARWYETEGKSGQGSAVYDFKATVNTPPVFYTTYANEAEFVPGDFFMITAKNIAKDADISFTAEPTINYTPTFFPDGEYYRSLIPISYELDSGTYTFTLESDGVSQSFTLNVNTKSFRTVNLTVDASIVNATRTENTLAKFESDLRPIANDAQTVKEGALFYGKFSEGVPSGAQLYIGVGLNCVINGGASFRHQGVEYLVSEGGSISAVNDGVVVYVGATDYSGNLVVVDHGLGLKSWYCHLAASSVSVGDTVTKGTVLGTAGSTGFTSQTSAHIGLSVFDVPVSPYPLWENELEMIKP